MLTKFAIDPERREEILRMLRRAALIALPAIGLAIFAGLLAWTIRRQLDSLTEGLVIEPNEEPAFDAPQGVSPA